MKKWILFFLLFLCPYLVNAKANFSIPYVVLQEQTEFQVPLKITNYEEFKVLGIKISYDQTKLEFMGGELNSLKNGLYHGLEQVDGVITIYAFNLSDELLEVSGDTIASLNFQAKEGFQDQTELAIEVTDYGFDEYTTLDYEVSSSIVSKTNEIHLTKDGISYSSQDEAIATVDEHGNVVFHQDGEVIVEGVDSEGNVIETITVVSPKVENEEEKSFPYYLVVLAFVFLFIIIGGILIYGKKKKTKKTS